VLQGLPELGGKVLLDLLDHPGPLELGVAKETLAHPVPPEKELLELQDQQGLVVDLAPALT